VRVDGLDRRVELVVADDDLPVPILVELFDLAAGGGEDPLPQVVEADTVTP